MGVSGFESVAVQKRVVLDGMPIDSPEAVVEHLERYEWPRIREAISNFSAEESVNSFLPLEREAQGVLGPELLKGYPVPYGIRVRVGRLHSITQAYYEHNIE